ncbi:AraC family transcriptional regulator [Paenibacillus maysiensis]|uniref:AraC family transcriptional regulator n=1 Tax=Paenibacillus maysiensis TaxID=1155954 RepID=UPI0004B38877|nr:AraC family transcriptional regulator [Paenibacillus maysiensis]
MNIKELDALLQKEEDVETLQKRTGVSVNDLKVPFDDKLIPKVSRELLFQEGNIIIRKHRRYAPVRMHTHDFVEMNYVYSGKCIQIINDERIELSAGDILLIDRDAPHSIEDTEKDDIILNVLLKEETIMTDIISNLANSNNLVTQFMLSASKKNEKHDRFLIFVNPSSDVLTGLMNHLFCVYFSEYSFKKKALNLYLSLILIELTNILEKNNLQSIDKDVNQEVLSMLAYIDRHYNSVSLDDLSKTFGYNKSYLSLKLKRETGSSFKDLLNRKKINVAKELLKETNMSVEEIALSVGYNESSSFFKLFKKYTHMTPSEYR